MTNSEQQVDDTIQILIGELMADEELRDAFLRNPEMTLRSARDWALPLSDSELRSLTASAHRLRDTIAEALEARWQAAA